MYSIGLLSIGLFLYLLFPKKKPIKRKEAVQKEDSTVETTFGTKLDVFFGAGLSRLPTEEEGKLYLWLAETKDLPFQYLVTGYADQSGNPSKNRKLCKERTKSVATLLQKKGIPTNHILQRTEEPLLGRTPEERMRYRKVEIQRMSV
ncbi:OmpA family protein [Leptospira ryugenii]|uniref:OmpA family protein n=1 Tax=Leptospira ryugenii TaxID=1917863 RepID=UPI001435535A|nr:OmpA family protein [Leptospira ryugenii]